MSDKLLFGYDNKTIRLRRYKNLQRQPRQQTSRLHLSLDVIPSGGSSMFFTQFLNIWFHGMQSSF